MYFVTCLSKYLLKYAAYVYVVDITYMKLNYGSRENFLIESANCVYMSIIHQFKYFNIGYGIVWKCAES